MLPEQSSPAPQILSPEAALAQANLIARRVMERCGVMYEEPKRYDDGIRVQPVDTVRRMVHIKLHGKPIFDEESLNELRVAGIEV